MINIGVITRSADTGNFFKDFFNKFKYKILPVTEYGFCFVVVGDAGNYRRIFNKYNVEYAVVTTDAEAVCCGCKIIDGTGTYKKLLPQMVRKIVKTNQSVGIIALVDKHFTKDCDTLADKLCQVCSTLVLVTENTDRANRACDRLMEEYGAVAQVADTQKPVRCDVAAVLENCGTGYVGCHVIFDIHGKPSARTVTDFHIPFRANPPLGLTNLVYADCIDIISAKSIDNI